MADFILLTNPSTRAIVQDRTLERGFHDALASQFIYRADMVNEEWGGNIGDQRTFTRPSLLKIKPQALPAGQDPVPSSVSYEQWEAFIQQYADTVDTHIPTDSVAAASTFARNIQQLGIGAAQTLNHIARNKLYVPYLSGHSTVTAQTGGFVAIANNATATITVRNLNGFTKQLQNGRPTAVSASNKLRVFLQSTLKAFDVESFTVPVGGDEIGSGDLLIRNVSGGSVTLAADDPILAENRPTIIRAGSGLLSPLGLVATDVFSLDLIRQAVAQLRQQNVPPHPDGFYHCHLDPISELQLFKSEEFQRLNTALPDYVMYRRAAIGELLGVIFYRNPESPSNETVDATIESIGNSILTTGSGGVVKVRRPIITGLGSIYEFYLDEMKRFMTDAGTTGKVGGFTLTNNGMAVAAERIRLTMRSPLDRLQQIVGATWSWSGDFPVPSDALSGNKSVFKRAVVIEHGS